jgi:hypothetical protein
VESRRACRRRTCHTRVPPSPSAQSRPRGGRVKHASTWRRSSFNLRSRTLSHNAQRRHAPRTSVPAARRVSSQHATGSGVGCPCTECVVPLPGSEVQKVRERAHANESKYTTALTFETQTHTYMREIQKVWRLLSQAWNPVEGDAQ